RRGCDRQAGAAAGLKYPAQVCLRPTGFGATRNARGIARSRLPKSDPAGWSRTGKEPAMPRIGEFKETDYGLKGHIHMREGRFDIELHHTGNKDKDGPHYQAKAPNGAEIGAAWNKIGASSHEPYLRLSIDDMAMPS